MYFFKVILLFVIVSMQVGFASTLENRYTSYTYVLHEFDVDDDYLYNEDFVHFANKNEKKLKQFYTRALLRGESLLPMIQGRLLEDGVSDLFMYLSMVESGFSTHAISNKKAAGLWQFMPSTAKHYNLHVGKRYDERFDAVSATNAAITYLSKLHRQFGKWYLAAMAYNCGEGRLQRAIKKAGTDDLAVLSNDALKYLPKETRDYIRKILLIAMIGESSLMGLDDVVESADGLVKVEVDRRTPIEKIAKILKMKVETLFNLNKQFKNKKIPSSQDYYMLSIPLDKIYLFYLRYEPPVHENVTSSNLITHQVKMGETLESLAKLYHTNEDDIRVMNHLEYPYLTVGALLVIPVSQKIFQKQSQ